MKCVNCGKDLNESAKFCDECGTPVNISADEPVVDTVVEKKEGAQIFQPESTSTENEETSVTMKFSVLPKKTKLFIGAGAAVIVVLLIVFFASLGGAPTNGGNVNNTPYDTPVNDDFGNNEVITAIPTEQITQAPVNVEVVYDDVIYCQSGSSWGAVKITDYNIQYTDNGEGLTIFFTYEKVANADSEKKRSFAADIYFYDAAGNVLDTSQALYVSDFVSAPIGKKYRDECQYFGKLKANISAQQIAKIEIMGG